jgi:NodT family efflux transporter outer membrane factor (OMF) lipoprotein
MKQTHQHLLVSLKPGNRPKIFLTNLMNNFRMQKVFSFIKSSDHFFSVLLLFIALLMMAGCAPKTQPVNIGIDTTEVFSATGQENAPKRWWTAFDDKQLNSLVDTALQSNFNLKTTWERLQAAQAAVDRQSSSFFPTIDASASGEVSKYQNQFIQNQSFRLGLSAGYEVDLWGRIQSRVEAERYRAKAAMRDYQIAAISLAAEITRTWYQLVEAQNQLELVNKQVETNAKVLDLIETRFGSGQIRSADILRQRRLLESTREQRIAAEKQVKLLEHKLAVLLGKTPQKEIEKTIDTLPKLPPMPETGVPADLIRRRPDVQAAYDRLMAADRELAAAISNQYPRFSISASASTSADNVESLFKDWARSLGGNLLSPIFYGGRLRAEVDQSESIRKQRLFEYVQTILNAFREVEDALVQEQKQLEKIQSIREQVKLARQTYEQLRIEYFNGMGGYLDVLTALDEVQRLQRNLISAHMNLLEYRIALYRSIAGSFETQREQFENQ